MSNPSPYFKPDRELSRRYKLTPELRAEIRATLVERRRLLRRIEEDKRRLREISSAKWLGAKYGVNWRTIQRILFDEPHSRA